MFEVRGLGLSGNTGEWKACKWKPTLERLKGVGD